MTNNLLASVSVRDSSLVLLTPNSVFFLYLKNLVAYWYNFIGKKMTILLKVCLRNSNFLLIELIRWSMHFINSFNAHNSTMR